ncbi:MAG: CdaR family protein [Cellulosilyticaceae bacterium]
MNKFFSNNLPWKIVSLLLATMLWVFVINTQNPILPKEIRVSNINIRGINELEAKGFALQNEEELRNLQVKVTIRGPRLEMDKILNDEKNLDVRIDLTPYANMLTSDDAESIEKPVNLIVNHNLEGIKIEEVKPETVSVIFEKEETQEITIYPKIQGGNNSEYMALEPVLNPRTVKISGPKSAVKSVRRAVVDINVDKFSQDAISDTVPIRLLDEKGEEVTGVKKSPEQIQITLPIGKKKKVPVEEQFKGTLPPGYIKTNTLVTPKEVTIVGDPKVIDGIDSIKLEAISLDNMIQSSTFNVNLLLPDNVTPIDKIEGKAVVTVEIQKESFYEYGINTKDLLVQYTGLPSTYEVEIVEGEIILVLSGTAENLLGITGKNVEAFIDLTTLGELSNGTYSAPITFKIPENLKVLSAPATVQVNIRSTEDVFNPDEVPEEDNTNE